MGTRIRPVTLLDLLPLSLPPAEVLRLDLAQQLLFPHHPLREMLSAWLHLQEPCYTLLCWGERDLLACAQAQPCPQNCSWEVRYLAVWKEALPAAQTLWGQLLVGLGLEAGRQRAMRLLARLPTAEHLDMFQQVGFSPFAEEMIMRWEGVPVTYPQPLPALPPVQDSDLWAIQQLHISLTPPIVQQAEGYSSASWQPRPGQEGWVWREGDAVHAYLRRRRGPQGTSIDLLLDPAFRSHAAALLAYSLVGVAPPVYLTLRGYQGELLEVAHRVGFRAYAEQTLLAKYLTAPQGQRQPVAGRQAEHQLEAAPSAPSVGMFKL